MKQPEKYVTSSGREGSYIPSFDVQGFFLGKSLDHLEKADVEVFPAKDPSFAWEHLWFQEFDSLWTEKIVVSNESYWIFRMNRWRSEPVYCVIRGVGFSDSDGNDIQSLVDPKNGIRCRFLYTVFDEDKTSVYSDSHHERFIQMVACRLTRDAYELMDKRGLVFTKRITH